MYKALFSKSSLPLFILFTTLLFGACQSKHKTDDDSTAGYSIEHEGLYKGTYPCADCSGIEVSLRLNKDSAFVYEMVYLDKPDGHFIHRGNYHIEDNILTIEDKEIKKHFSIEEKTLTRLDDHLQPNHGTLADYYRLQKQISFDYPGRYETFNEEKGGYTQSLTLTALGGNEYKAVFSATKVKGREGCHFSGIGELKNDTLWFNISNEKGGKVPMYIAPSHDNLGVNVFTSHDEDRFMMMYYCQGGASLAGSYLKNTISDGNIGVLNDSMSIADVVQTLPRAQIHQKAGRGEFAEDVYDDYEIYTHRNQLLLTITPQETGSTNQKINRVFINSPFFQTEKGISKNSTYEEIKKAYTIDRIEPTREYISLIVGEINAVFNIKKDKLKPGWWDEKAKTVKEDKIPPETPIDDFFLWWNEEVTGNKG